MIEEPTRVELLAKAEALINGGQPTAADVLALLAATLRALETPLHV